jgi:hypothetical protein
VPCGCLKLPTTGHLLLQAYDDKGNKRLSGGEAFSVLLVPATSASTVNPPDITTTNSSSSSSSSMGNSGTPVDVDGGAQQGMNGHENHQEQQQKQQQEPGMAAECEGSVVDHGDGSYTCSYQATRAGRYMLHVLTGAGGGTSHAARYPMHLSVMLQVACVCWLVSGHATYLPKALYSSTRHLHASGGAPGDAASCPSHS